MFYQVVLVALLSPVLSLLPYYIQVRMMTTFGGRSWYMYTRCQTRQAFTKTQ